VKNTVSTSPHSRSTVLKQDEIIAHLKTSSRVASISTREGTLRIFYDMMSRSMLAMITIILIFASAISVGVVYNTAMILLSERTFELGSLRILGFTKAEVFEMIASELGTHNSCLACTRLRARVMVLRVADDEHRRHRRICTIKLIITSRTYVTAMLVSLGTAAYQLSVILYFRIRKMDLVSVLKVRE
jgi:putative ABC transport system permease protein